MITKKKANRVQKNGWTLSKKKNKRRITERNSSNKLKNDCFYFYGYIEPILQNENKFQMYMTLTTHCAIVIRIIYISNNGGRKEGFYST